MEINFTRNNFNYLLVQEKFIWKRYLKGALGLFSVFAIVGALFLLDAIDKYSKTGNIFGLSFSLAFGLILSTTLNLPYLLFARWAGFKKTKQMIAQYKKENESVAIKITNWGITSKAPDVSSEFSWSYFEGYKESGNSLLLIPRHHTFQDLFFVKDEMPIENYNELISFLKNKFPAQLKTII